MKQRQDVKFVLNEVSGAQFFFTSYADREGNNTFLKIGTNQKTGAPIKAKIFWPPNKRIISFPAKKTDIDGTLFADYVRNSPYCKGSPNCVGEGMFYEFNPEKDAKVLIEETSQRLKAENHALTVGGRSLSALANISGCHVEDEDMQRASIIEFARRDPVKYMTHADNDELLIVALIESARRFGIIRRKGIVQELHIEGAPSTFLGKKDKDVVKSLIDNEELFDAINDLVKAEKSKL